ncbi:MAG: type II secretion system protein N [Woeseiaceae bacterium]
MIKTRRGLLIVAVLTLIAALLLMFPARVAYQWAAPPSIAMSGIHGTVWRGNADAMNVEGIYFKDVAWTINPLRLFTGQANFHFKASPVAGFVEANVGIGLGGTLRVSDLAAALPLSLFADAVNVQGLQGDASLQFDRIVVRDGLPVAASGTLRVSRLLAPRLSREPLGGYEAEFFTQNNGIAATIEDTDGVLDLAGSLQLSEDRNYQFLGKVIAAPEAPASLKRQLEYLGSADERGQRELRLEGTL